MTTRPVDVGPVTVGGGHPLAFIGGPCVVESEAHALGLAERLVRITSDHKIPFIFKSSYDKANRSSGSSFRGPGLYEGLKVLRKVKEVLKVPVLSDVHLPSQVEPSAEVLDALQIPAFLCRQTDLILAAGHAGKPVNVKKGQFLAPWEMKNVVDKLRSTGNERILLTERGVSFGYNTLVVDFRSLPVMTSFGYPVVFDATHSVQAPGGQGDRAGGERQYVPHLARAAVAVGCDALFMEVHNDPDRALSDAPTMLHIQDLPRLLEEILAIDRIVRGHP